MQHHQQRLQQRGSSPPVAVCLLRPSSYGEEGRRALHVTASRQPAFRGHVPPVQSPPALTHSSLSRLIQSAGGAGAPLHPTRSPALAASLRSPGGSRQGGRRSLPEQAWAARSPTARERACYAEGISKIPNVRLLFLQGFHTDCALC